MAESNAKLYTLHRYFIWANRMRFELGTCVRDQAEPPAEEGEERRQWLLLPLMYQSYWLATLFVLVEGWQTLKLCDPAVDALLADED